MKRIASILMLCTLAAGLRPDAALAHNLRLFATVVGGAIEGTTYFTGGTKARGAAIEAIGPDGSVLGQTRSSGDGSFRLPVGGPIEHMLIADTGDGHRARFIIRAAEVGGTPADAAPSEIPVGPSANNDIAQTITQAVDRALARQLAPLREQIDSYESKVRLHDILGGLGYIVGLAGLALWWTSRASSRKGQR